MRYVKYLVKMVRLLCSTGWGGSILDRLLLVGGAFCSCFHHQDAEEEDEDDDDAEEEEEVDDVEEEEENDAEDDEVPKYYCQWTTIMCQGTPGVFCWVSSSLRGQKYYGPKSSCVR